jgi:bacterioferritin-associated ferredoxin
MYICICNAVSEDIIRACIRKGCRTLECIEEETGAMSECSSCMEEVETILEDEIEKIEKGE